MAVDREGTVWATTMDDWRMDPAGCLARLVGDRWEVVEPFGPRLECYPEVEVSPDGDVWISGEAHSHEYAGVGGSDGVAARFDGRTWTVYDEADGLVVDDGRGYGPIAAAPDGSVWVAGPAGLELVAGTGAAP